LQIKLIIRRSKPYPTPCELNPLKGEQLKEQLERWVAAGTIEPSARDAISKLASGLYLDLSDRCVSSEIACVCLRCSYFVLLGAGAAMGPYEVLLQFGANIIAIDLDRKGIWDRLIKIARASSGTLTFPLKVCVFDITVAAVFRRLIRGDHPARQRLG
jgi:hypothetical protein